jgi:HTH-type transcriptional regulator, competence development regulator
MVDDFGKYLKMLRGEKTLKEVKSIAGVSMAYLSKIERGLREKPAPEILRKLAPAYNISYEKLMVAAGYLDDDNTVRLSGYSPEEITEITNFANFLKKEHETENRYNDY